MDLSARTLEDLGFPGLLRELGRRCRTAPGRERAMRRPFLDSREAVRSSLQQIDEGRRLRTEGYRLPLDSIRDVREAVAHASKGALLEPRALIDVAQTLFALDRAREGLSLQTALAPTLAGWAHRLPALEPLAARLDRAFDAAGDLQDGASPALRSARERTRSLHRTIKSQLERLLHDETFVPHLRESYYSVRNERYVLPILAASRADVPGIVHNASQSGQTLFVEPQGLIGLGNDLAIAQSLVLEEERRVLQGFSDEVGREADRILAGLETVGTLDEVEAAAQLAEELDAHTPDEPSGGDLRLRALRHPFLVLQETAVVANDVELTGEVRALVISGPNAGGKTVTLTAVGLAALMLRTGLPIAAAEGSRMPLYPSVHSAVGDAQSLQEGLSTFSAHLLELRGIVEAVGSGVLVLIDEIAADTDPQEGAALAIAVLEEVLERGATAIVTTHLEELKALAHVDPRFGNARVGFDPERRAPTYRLQLGAAGASSAIALAERMGLPARLCARARERVQGSGGALAQALRAVEEERARLATEATTLETARTAAEAARRKTEEEQSILREAQERETRLHREKLQRELERVVSEARAQLSALKQSASVAQAEEAVSGLRAQVHSLEQETLREEAARAAPAPADLRPGAWVRHLGLGRDVEVLEIEGDDALVAAGSLKLRASRSELASASSVKPPPRFVKVSDRAQLTRERAEPDLSRCDLRGMRADEAIRQLEGFLNRFLRAGEASAFIVHGHGTGALKAAVRQYLETSPYVDRFRPGQSHEGGDGVTVVSLARAAEQ